MLGGVGDVTVVDLCTGSGAIALAIADEIPQARVFAVERDAEAFAWAARNVQALAQSAGVSPSQPGVCPDSGAQSADQSHPAIPAENGDDPHPADRAMTSPLPAGPPPRVTLIRGDARTALPELNGTVDVVVSNPPYVPSEAIPRDPEVAEYDPPQALYGLGAEGLEIPRGIAKAAARLLKPGGVFIMEHGDEQGEAVRRLVAHVSEPLSEPESEPLSRPVPEPLTSTHPTQASPSQPTKGQPAPHASSQIQHPPTPAFTHIHTIHDLTGRDRMVHARRMEH
jgi:release factor glutamine methyltransferase